jgi:twitching motility two-component system response regulator PilG
MREYFQRMTIVHPDSPPVQRNIFEYLQSLRVSFGDLDIQVRGGRRTGFLQVRQGQVVAARSGRLLGNGALLTLVGSGAGEVRGAGSVQPVRRNVSVTGAQIERFFANLSGLSQDDSCCDEEETLQEALRLFFQFRRKEAGAKLVEVLRSNRFYYPAWLWHSRLMTREDHIKKALNEAGKWGNAEPSIGREVRKIQAQFTGSTEPVRRCIFCWSLVGPGQEYCDYCRGLQRISNSVCHGQPATEELQQTLSLYEEQMPANPRNSRLAYGLCLGFCSLGQIDRAREYIGKALTISPREPLFVRAATLLQPVHDRPRPEPITRAAVQQQRVENAATDVQGPSSGDRKIPEDKTVLVVEDSKTARKVISMVLGRGGYKIIEAANGTEALLAIEGVLPDLVLLDVMLPDMTGYEVLSAIRRHRRLTEVPVVMLTGKRDSADRLKGMTGGSNEYLTKPFDPARLLAVLAKYLEPSAPAATAPQPHYVKKAVSPPAAARPEPAAKGPSASRPAPAAAGSMANGPGKSVLVVEDSPTSRKVISMVLSRKGYVVNEAANGGEALRQVAERRPHLILLDAMLPDMTGYDVLAQLKQDPRLKEIPVVMLTAKDSPVDRQKGMRAGSVAYLTKPFNPDKLLSVIGGYI